MLMIASGYEDGNDATALWSDPEFKLGFIIHHLSPGKSAPYPFAAPHGAGVRRFLLRLFQADAKADRARFRRHVDAVHGGQQLRLFNAHYDEYGFQPMLVFDGEGRFVAAVLRPAKHPSGIEIRAFLRRLLRAIRATRGRRFRAGAARRR
jgi:hypothetical protein